MCKRKLSDTLDFITDSNTPAAENAFIGIPLEKRGGVIHRERDSVPGIDRLFYSIFIHQGLKIALPLLFTAGADHGVIEKNQLKLEPSRFEDLGRAGEDLHPFFRRGETGRKEFGLSFLLDDAKTAGPKGNKPPIMTEGRDSYPGGLSGLKDRRPSLNGDLGTIDCEFDLICHDSIKFLGVMEYWSTGVLGLILIGPFVSILFHHSVTPSLQHSVIFLIRWPQNYMPGCMSGSECTSQD
jgi:hypothetical protein